MDWRQVFAKNNVKCHENVDGCGDWEVALAQSDDEPERKNGVTYIFKRNTEKRKA